MAQRNSNQAVLDGENPLRKPRVLRAKQRAEAAIEGIKVDAAKSPEPPKSDAVVQTTNARAPALIESAPARPARTRRRHRFLALSFVLLFVVPVTLAAYYLWTFAADQYASNLAFSVRSEEQGSAVELLGGVTELSGSSSADTDILFAYLTSQELVSKVNDRLDLAQIWSKVTVNNDPFFAYDPAGTIEDLLAHQGGRKRKNCSNPTGHYFPDSDG